MSNDQNKAGTNPISNKQLATAPAPLIIPPARRGAAVNAGKSGKSLHKQANKDLALPGEDQPQLDMSVAPDDGAIDRTRTSADAATSVRRGNADEDEMEAALEKAARRHEGEELNHEDVILLAQAGPGAGADAPVSVGEELLRQAAPVPRSSKSTSNTDFFESMFGKDWKLPVAIGGGALALIGLAAGGGGGGGGADNAGANANSSDSGKIGPVPAAPSNTWTLSITPAAGPFLQGATVRATVQKLVNGSWQDIGSTANVDKNGRMTIKIDKSAVSPADTLRVVLADTDGGGNDHNDEVAGAQTLGSTPLVAIIGNLSSDQQVTVNPLTTLAANKIGQDLSAANVAAVHAAVAKAFGISTADLVHLLPGLLGLPSSANASADSKNYGLALGIISGMAQAQKDAGQPPDQAIGKALEVLARAFVIAKDGSLALDLPQVRQLDVEVKNPDGTTKTVGVGLDEGAARRHHPGRQRPQVAGHRYFRQDARPAGGHPGGHRYQWHGRQPDQDHCRHQRAGAELKEKLRESDQRFKANGLSKVEKPNQKERGNSLKSTTEADLAKEGASERILDASGAAGNLDKGVEALALRPSVLIVRFRPGTVDLNAPEAKRMTDTFLSHFDWNARPDQTFVISTTAVEGLSESNRMAFYRVVAVRNHLLSVGVPAARIRQRIEPVPAARQSGTEALEIRIQKIE